MRKSQFEVYMDALNAGRTDADHYDPGRLKLQIKIFTGETTDKYLANLRSRTGHTFKKMMEVDDPLGGIPLGFPKHPANGVNVLPELSLGKRSARQRRMLRP